MERSKLNTLILSIFPEVKPEDLPALDKLVAQAPRLTPGELAALVDVLVQVDRR